MSDFLDTLTQQAKATIASRYYERINTTKPVRASLKKAILQCKAVPVIAEVKGASPSKGIIRQDFAASEIASAMASGGAAGLSVLTEPKRFNGSLDNLIRVRKTVNLPILMKDFVLSSTQLDAAVRTGANAVLLIQALFDRGYCDTSLDRMIAEAHAKNLEVLLETHDIREFTRAVTTDADLIGINNRDLGTLKIDLNVTKDILSQIQCNDKLIVSESGINSPEDIRFLRACGAKAFLIGSAIMQANDVRVKVREFVNA
jgi:indole-3-glycerol phosphate synthase